MADWSGLLEAKKTGYAIGKDAGGKLSGLGIALKEVASKLEEKRQTATALETLGKTEQIKQMYNPPEWKPTTKEEAITFEQEKNALTNQPQAIVDERGVNVGFRPKGSVFAPSGTSKELTLANALSILSDPMKATQLKRQYPNLYAKAEQVVRDNLGEESLTNPNTPKKLPKPKIKGSVIEDNIMDTNW